MSIAKDIAQILHDDSVGELGVSLFISQMPEDPDNAIAVYEMSGSAYDAVSGLSSAVVSVKARDNSYEEAYSLISHANEVLSAIGDEKYSSTCAGVGFDHDNDSEDDVIYLRVAPNSEPYPAGRDSKERVEFAQSFSVTFCRL